VWAKFAVMTCDDYWDIEKEASVVIKATEEREDDTTTLDHQEFQRLTVLRLLRSWSLDVPLEFDDETGWLTTRCAARVLGVCGPLLRALVEKYEEHMRIDDEESKKIERQSLVLFNSNRTGGVSNPCEAVSLFCLLGNFWEKFGLNRFQIGKLPYREYYMLRLMLANESDAHARDAKRRRNKGKPTMIAGPGGRTRPSRGIVVGD